LIENPEIVQKVINAISSDARYLRNNKKTPRFAQGDDLLLGQSRKSDG